MTITYDSPYWRSAADDEAMQDEHGFIWQAIIDTIDLDLKGCRVLDAGCNQGGFLRLLVDKCGIAEGFGYDPAAGAVQDAQRLSGERPLHFETSTTVPAHWSGFDLAFSHEVLYLLHDLPSHAASVYRSISPGGVYFAVMGVHAGSPLMAEWHAANQQELRLPALYHIDDVIGVFQQAGFDPSVSRLAIRFVPCYDHEHHHLDRTLEWLTYYCEYKLLLRLARR